MSMIPLSWAEIRSWVLLTSREVTPDEVRLIRKLSFIYVSQYTSSKDIATTAPYPDEEYVLKHAAEQRDRKK